jgi:fucose 4-O-acetylase-like acetyltransferase
VASTTILFGVLMILLGVGGYFVTGRQSLTALIPAIPGLIWVVLGVLARNERLRKHAMHVAAALSALGFIAMIRAIVTLVRWQTGGAEPERPAAVVSQAILGVLLLVFLILCVRSFIAARRARLSSPSAV